MKLPKLPSLGKLAGEAAAEPIEALANGLDQLFTSKDEKLTHAEIMERIRQAPHLAQSDTNQTEAAHRSVFVAGWRPFIGWVCGISLAFFFIPRFVLISVFWMRLVIAQDQLLPFPTDGSDSLFELVFALLGLGLMRTVEKIGGKTK